MGTTNPFKFGDRLDVTTSEMRPLAARIRFLRSLIRQDFKETDLLVRYFFYEPFHDGSIWIDSFDLSSSRLEVTFENVAAMDQVMAVTPMLKRASDRARYRTRVLFKGVSAFEVRSATPLTRLKYYSGEFWRLGDNHELRVFFSTGISAKELGQMRIKFRAIEVKDISRSLKTFARKSHDVSVWLMKKPPKLTARLQSDLRLLSSMKAKGRT